MIEDPSELAPLVTRMFVQAPAGGASAAAVARHPRAIANGVSFDVIVPVPP